MSKELATVILFCLKHADDAPVTERVSLYRGLAEFCGEPKRAAEFRRQADALESADFQCREFAFQLTNRLIPTQETT